MKEPNISDRTPTRQELFTEYQDEFEKGLAEREVNRQLVMEKANATISRMQNRWDEQEEARRKLFHEPTWSERWEVVKTDLNTIMTKIQESTVYTVIASLFAAAIALILGALVYLGVKSIGSHS